MRCGVGDEEIAVSRQDEGFGACVSEVGEGVKETALLEEACVVAADPEIKQVTEDVEFAGAETMQERDKCRCSGGNIIG